MPIDPTDIYDKGLSDDDLTKKQSEMLSGSPSYMGGQVSMYKPVEYTGYLTGGLFEDKGDPDIQRGEAQSAWDKWGNMIPQTIGKIGTQLLDMAGGLQSLLFEWGDDRDYQNVFTEGTDAANAWLDRNFPMYRTSKDLVDFTDAAWWTQNISGLTASVAGFALGGTGIAKGLGALGRLGKIGKGVEAGLALLKASPANAAKLAQLGEKTLTAGTLAFAEGAMSGRRVFNETYTAQLAAGKSEQEAQSIAAQSAATTVQLNTMLNTGLNMAGGMGMFFNHGSDEVMKAAKRVLKQEAGESTEAYLKRLKEFEPTTYRWAGAEPFAAQKDALKRVGIAAKEAGAEGVEELNNLFAEQVGIQEGKKGEVHGFLEQLSLLSDYFDHTMNAEGALNFVLGAIAGPVQNTVASYLPLHKVVKGAKTVDGKLVDAQGNPVENPEDADVEYYNEGRRMSSVQRSKVFKEKYFSSIKDKIVDDVSHILNTQEDLRKAVASGDVLKAEEIRRTLFDVHNTNSVLFGMEENLKTTYEDLKNVDNEVEDENGITAAMKLGLAKNKQDNAYKVKATEALEDLTQLKKLHDAVYNKYGIDKDFGKMEDVHLADFIFQTAADLYQAKQSLKRSQEELSSNDTDVMNEVFNQTANDLALTEKARRDYMRKYRRHLTHVENYNKTKAIIDTALASLQTGTLAGAVEAENALNDLGLFVMEGESGMDFLQRSLTSLKALQEKRASEVEQFGAEVLESESYTAWKEKPANADKTLQDYYDTMGKTLQESAYSKRLNSRISHLEDKVAVLEEANKQLTQAKTLSKLKKNSENYFKELQKLQKKIKEQRLKEVQETELKDDTIRGYNSLIIKRLIQRYTKQLEKNAIELGKITKKIDDLKSRLEVMTDYWFGEPIIKVERDLQAEIAKAEKLTEESNAIEEYLVELESASTTGITVPTFVPPTPPAPTTQSETVTIPKRGNPEKISTPIELSIETEPIFLAQGQTIIKGGTWYEYKGKNYIITKDGRSIYSEDGLNRPSELAEIVIKDGTKIEQPISTTQSEIEKKTKEISDLEERLKEPLLRPVIFEDDYSPSQLRDLKETWAKQDEEERIIIRKEIAQKQAELKELEQQPILGVQPQADNTALDEFFERVARFVVTSDIEIKPITLVKQFNLGYNRATKIINQLEAAGIVEANTDDKPRKLMIQSEAELDSILENIKKPTTQSGSNPALSDVESTAKALRENEEKGGKPIPTTLIPKQEFEVLNNGNRGLNDIIAETYHKAKAKPENTRTEQEQELIKAVESALTGEAEKILEQQPISTTQSEIDTKKAEIEKEKASITNSEFTELKRLAKFFLENPKEPTVSESVVTRYPALFKALTDIERRKKQSLSEKEWSTGPVKGAYLRQESDGRWSSMYFKPSTTGVDGEGVYRNTKEEVIAELEKMYNAELAALQSVSTGGKANVVKVYHHTNVALQDFNFGSFQRGNQQISQFGDGLNASSTTTPFLIQRYGNPIEGEINDSDFVVIDANKSEKELYEELKAKGYKFNNPARGSYIGNNPAKEYDGAEKANVQPAIISLFNDFQKSNPQVKGVKVINHIIGGQKVDSFYVIYDAKSFYGPGSLSKTQPISTNQSEDLNYSTLLLKFKTDGLALGVSTSDMKEALNLAAETGQISLNHFTQFNVSAEDSAKLVTLLKDILAAKEVLVKLADDTIENAQEHANPVPSEEEETEDIFDFVEDNSLEVNLSDAPIPVKKSTGGVEGMKQEYPATSGAHRSTLFFEQRNKSGKIERRGIPVADDTTIFTVLDSSKLLPGTKVQIEIDFEYKGDMVLPDTQVSKTPKAVPQQTISAKDLLENLNSFPLEGTEEFEKLVQELPLKITLNGKTVQWLHLPKWILSKDPNTSGTGSEDYRNVVDSKIDPKTGEYIIEPGNALREAAYLASIRRSILKLLAAGETVEVEVSSKGEGILLPASEEYSAVNLKETRIQGGEKKNVAVPIAISTDTGLKGLENTPQISTQINPEYDIEPGRIVALIPMADGSRVPVSLKGKRLSELPNTVHTFHRALELFLGPLNAPEVETIESSTGFDIRDREGIRNYMAQYFTYFTSPTALRTGINLVLSNKTISVVTVTDAGTYETILELDPATQKLTRESTSALSKLLETRYRAVAFSNKDRNLVGLNDSSSSQFSYPQYSPETGWAVKNYPSYNDFLLKDLTSPVMPLNAADRGVEYTKEQGAEYPGKYYFYAVNPVTQYDFSPVLGRAKLGVNEALIPVGTATEVSESAQANKSAEKSFEEIMGIEDKAIPISSVGTQNTGIVNLDNLTELYNFTPQSDRNDLTPVEVLTRLRQLNVSHIPPGYNPFKRCT